MSIYCHGCYSLYTELQQERPIIEAAREHERTALCSGQDGEPAPCNCTICEAVRTAARATKEEGKSCKDPRCDGSGARFGVTDTDEALTLFLRQLPWYTKLYDKVLRFWGGVSPRTLYRAAKRFIQRGYRGWADADVWNLDDHLSGVLAETLKRKADTLYGYPSGYDLDSWRAVLIEMSKVFERYHNNDTGEINPDDWALLGRIWGDLWD